MIQYIVIVGAAVNLFGAAIYIRDIFREKTKPNLVSWVLWAAAPLIASGAAFSEGVRWAVLPTFMVGFGPVLVIIASLIKRNAIWKPNRFDYFCGALSLIALVFWIITKEANAAITFAVIADGLAALPTLKKAWVYPETESGIIYTTALFNMLTTLAALKIFNYSELAFPIYNVLANIALSFAVYRKRILS